MSHAKFPADKIARAAEETLGAWSEARNETSLRIQNLATLSRAVLAFGDSFVTVTAEDFALISRRFNEQ